MRKIETSDNNLMAIGDDVIFVSHCPLTPECHIVTNKEYRGTIVEHNNLSTTVHVTNEAGTIFQFDVMYNSFNAGLSTARSVLDPEVYRARVLAHRDVMLGRFQKEHDDRKVLAHQFAEKHLALLDE